MKIALNDVYNMLFEPYNSILFERFDPIIKLEKNERKPYPKAFFNEILPIEFIKSRVWEDKSRRSKILNNKSVEYNFLNEWKIRFESEGKIQNQYMERCKECFKKYNYEKDIYPFLKALVGKKKISECQFELLCLCKDELYRLIAALILISLFQDRINIEWLFNMSVGASNHQKIGEKNKVKRIKNELEEYREKLINAVMGCSVKWGSCTRDDVEQNSNTCEGILALLYSHKQDTYIDIINNCLGYLQKEKTSRGLISKSLNIETIVPTSMYLRILTLLEIPLEKEQQELLSLIWQSKSSDGWGIYLQKMPEYCNIGCTYWAIEALANCKTVDQDEFQKFLRGLFPFVTMSTYRHSINQINRKKPYTYSTAMMFIIYSYLSDESRSIIGNRYDRKKALDFILDYFDDDNHLIESEELLGAEMCETTTITKLPWNHISVHYCLKAIAIAIKENLVSIDSIVDVCKRVIVLIQNNSESLPDALIWTSSTLEIDRGRRGKMIFPTMHLIMGISQLIDALTDYIKH